MSWEVRGIVGFVVLFVCFCLYFCCFYFVKEGIHGCKVMSQMFIFSSSLFLFRFSVFFSIWIRFNTDTSNRSLCDETIWLDILVNTAVDSVSASNILSRGKIIKKKMHWIMNSLIKSLYWDTDWAEHTDLNRDRNKVITVLQETKHHTNTKPAVQCQTVMYRMQSFTNRMPL